MFYLTCNKDIYLKKILEKVEEAILIMNNCKLFVHYEKESGSNDALYRLIKCQNIVYILIVKNK